MLVFKDGDWGVDYDGTFYRLKDVSTGYRNKRDKWLAANPEPKMQPGYKEGEGGDKGDMPGGGEGTVPTAPQPPEYVKDILADLGIGAYELQNMYRQIANEGVYNPADLAAILGQSEQGQDITLQSLWPYFGAQSELYDTGTQNALANIASLSAAQRNRQMQGVNRAYGSQFANRPGVLASMVAGTAGDLFANQQNLAYGAQQQGIAQKQALLEAIKNQADQLTLGRGDQRSGLIEQNLASRYNLGLPGIAGSQSLLQSLITGQPWNQSLPISEQYAFNAANSGLGNRIWQQQAGMQQTYAQLNALQQFQYQQELMKLRAELQQQNQPNFLQTLGGGLLSGLGSLMGTNSFGNWLFGGGGNG